MSATTRLSIRDEGHGIGNVVDQHGTIQGYGFHVDRGLASGEALKILTQVYGTHVVMAALGDWAVTADGPLADSVQTLQTVSPLTRATNPSPRASRLAGTTRAAAD